MKHILKLHVNGEEFEVLAATHKTLLEVLREDLGLTGTKRGCDLGTCGACTVLIDGKPQLSCLILAVSTQGKEITTIEGLAQNGELHPLQKAFVEKGAIQCGFCTPGMILTAKAFLNEHPHPSEAEVRQAISGNLCRCTGYVKIVEAIISVDRESFPLKGRGQGRGGRHSKTGTAQ
jgi:aerobic carbon-monoxide dehydrogenase small subunit